MVRNYKAYAASKDVPVVLQSLLVAATQAEDTEVGLTRLHEVATANHITSEIVSAIVYFASSLYSIVQDVLAAVPLLLPLACNSAGVMLDTISNECSAKELLIAIQESSESLRMAVNADQDGEDEQGSDDSQRMRLGVTAQSTRLLRLSSSGKRLDTLSAQC